MRFIAKGKTGTKILSVFGPLSVSPGNSTGQGRQRVMRVVKAQTHPRMCPHIVTGLGWVLSQCLGQAAVALETGSAHRAGLRAAIQVVLLRGSPSEMTNAPSLTRSWKHSARLPLTAETLLPNSFYFIRSVFTVRRAGCSGGEPDLQHPVLQLCSPGL